MHIDPTTPDGLAYIADHLGATYDADDLAAFLEDDLIKCEDCGRLYTNRHDFDLDAIDNEGVWVCDECACGAHSSGEPSDLLARAWS